jgi:hypothetical protein
MSQADAPQVFSALDLALLTWVRSVCISIISISGPVLVLPSNFTLISWAIGLRDWASSSPNLIVLLDMKHTDHLDGPLFKAGIKEARMAAFDGRGHRDTVHKCLNCEIRLEGGSYLLESFRDNRHVSCAFVRTFLFTCERRDWTDEIAFRTVVIS